MKRVIPLLISFLWLSVSCKTVQFDTIRDAGPDAKQPGVESPEDEQAHEKKAAEKAYIEEELKEVDVEKTVIYIDRPVYSPVEVPNVPALHGTAAVNKSTQESIQVPLKFVNGKMYYPWDDTFTYEVHCQPYRTTDIQLEPGEQVLEMPFLSEEKVWEIGAGVSRKAGLDVQHFFVKPTYSGLTTSMIIITDRRVYHLLLKSFKDTWMVMVQWEYPPSMPFTVKQDAINSLKAELHGDGLVNPEFLSFDYKMRYSIFRKPVWLPKRVYDDGRKTYIELDEKMLHLETPVIFNHRNERINYRVNKNMVILDTLIEKITVVSGQDKVTIIKKRYETPAAESSGGKE